ncbi:hypothetical protein KAW50_03300 [candidate division WOR-3 bacterium]|nr:hypothetical protein [candidate division WOR-3 bacterium]
MLLPKNLLVKEKKCTKNFQKVNLKKMQFPSHHIIEKIREYTNEIDSKRYEPMRIEIWWHPEPEVATKPKITPFGSLLTEADIKEISAGDAHDIEKIIAKQSTSYSNFHSEGTRKENTKSFASNITITNLSNLTHKQLLALFLQCMKLTKKKAADTMKIDTSTYRQHLKYAFKKLGLNNQIPPKT